MSFTFDDSHNSAKITKFNFEKSPANINERWSNKVNSKWTKFLENKAEVIQFECRNLFNQFNWQINRKSERKENNKKKSNK